MISLFEFKFDRLNINLIVFDRLRSKKSKKFKTSSLFYVSYFDFLYNYFVNFIV
jgi:hypothetical protein